MVQQIGMKLLIIALGSPEQVKKKMQSLRSTRDQKRVLCPKMETTAESSTILVPPLEKPLPQISGPVKRRSKIFHTLLNLPAANLEPLAVMTCAPVFPVEPSETLATMTRAPAFPPLGKPLPQISWPAKRLSVQLPRNVQAAAAAASDKNPFTDITIDGAVKRAHVSESKQKSDISPDTSEEPKLKRRKDPMTLIPTARTKADFGITDKPIQSPIYDIDALDVNNQLAVVDYVEDIYTFYKLYEQSCRPRAYIDSQAENDVELRTILADWLIGVHNKYNLMPESLYLTFNIIDRFLSLKRVLRSELQLVGISAMHIALKYEEIQVAGEEIRAPAVNDFICISGRAYSKEQILGMEKNILNVLEWSLTVPTTYMFLTRFIKAAMCDKEMEHMVFFFAELGLMQYALVTYCPSVVAAAAVYAARCTLKKNPLWTETLAFYSGFTDTQLLDCAQILVKCHVAVLQDKVKSVYKKYSGVQFNAVALNPPATQLLEELKSASSVSHY